MYKEILMHNEWLINLLSINISLSNAMKTFLQLVMLVLPRVYNIVGVGEGGEPYNIMTLGVTMCHSSCHKMFVHFPGSLISTANSVRGSGNKLI